MAERMISTQAPAKQEDVEYRLRKLVVAHDASEASGRALDDAIFLAKKFGAEILVAHVESMEEETLQQESLDNHVDLEYVQRRLTAAGLQNQEILRAGVVGDTLFNLCCEVDADLLLLGAYGYGPQDRSTLGSTAEYLLRAIPCPTLTYGPSITSSLSSVNDKGPVLVPISLPFNHTQLRKTVGIAKLFGIKLEILHVEDFVGMPVTPQATEEIQQQCEQVALWLRQEGAQVEWSLLYGKPAAVIDVRSLDLDSPFILMPLRWRERLSSITSDNVAAHVIRSSKVPVMTYRAE